MPCSLVPLLANSDISYYAYIYIVHFHLSHRYSSQTMSDNTNVTPPPPVHSRPRRRYPEPQTHSSGIELQPVDTISEIRQRNARQPHDGSGKTGDSLPFLKVFQERGEASRGCEHCLIICWASTEGEQWAVDIPTKDVDDQVQVWRDIRQKWFETPSIWRKLWRKLLHSQHKISVKEANAG